MPGEDKVDLAVVAPDWALNNSDQTPVNAILNVGKKIETPSELLVCYKPKWDKYDNYKYKDFVSKHIQSFRSYKFSNFPGFDNLYPLSHLTYVLQLETRYNIPSFKSELILRIRKKRPWSENKINWQWGSADLHGVEEIRAHLIK